MTRLAKINPNLAIACPSCQERLEDVPLDDIAAGVAYHCPHCTQELRMSGKVLTRLMEQRDLAALEAHEQRGPVGRFLFWLGQVFRGLFSGT